MISELPAQAAPQWLLQTNSNDDLGQLDVATAFRDSVFYPAAGTDGRPVQYLAGNFHSFVYADYGVTQAQLDEALQMNGFEGYHLLLSRNVSAGEIASPVELDRIDDEHMLRRSSRFSRGPFHGRWMIFERSAGTSSDHGPGRFSLLYLGMEGVQGYCACYLNRGFVPEAICIIQPGTSFGGNWTNFGDPHAELGRSVLRSQRIPNYLLHGGIGGRHFYVKPCWPQFSRLVTWLGTEQISLWERQRGMGAHALVSTC